MEKHLLSSTIPALPRPRFTSEDLSHYPSRHELKSLVSSLDGDASAGEYARVAYFCGEHRALREAQELHAKAIHHRLELDAFLGKNIVKMYLKCGSVMDASKTLQEMVEPDVILWTETIAEHTKRGMAKEALRIFQTMQLNGVAPNKITFLAALNACSRLEDLGDIHDKIVQGGAESNPMVATTIIHRYSKFSSSGKARQVFDKVRDPDVFVYNVMVAAYAKDGLHEESLGLFQRMQMEGITPDKITFLAMLDSCQDERALKTGFLVHRMIEETGLGSAMIDISTGLISMYSKCGDLEAAKAVFQKVAEASIDEVLYTAIAEAHARRGSLKDSLEIITRMHQSGVKPGRITFTAVLDGSSGRASQKELEQLQAAIAGFEHDVDVATALVNSYGKSGMLGRAREIFEAMEERSVITWSSIIAAYAHHNRVSQALELFEEMQQSGFAPSPVTFLSVLSACSHRGLLYRAITYFASMIQDYGLTPLGQHYGCVVDLFGRSGEVGDAEELVERMPVEPDQEAWMALLRACRERDDAVRVGLHAGERVLELDPGWESGYVVLSSVYAP
ncbi:pentatricopeptide repeat-containing protein At3g12770 [Selaginella moellendorffii]|uniref:pentatricopeptide repeat-containing protein At3g12770 n=1 Tax=Selaginella moellendorffii TaxID=88036 RepID=UPI000D1C325F|nr:pentatricopeptide repeat-containing protein At3g12770 [Selaginella moellendorffii]|eukprot:XP_024541535.1 pentatricopeptide repeat-containing protein At3g12770 [Selaginella moellendorffii]